jgi:hypothetical protein
MVLSILMFTAVPQGRAADLSPDEIRQIAAEAYVYLYPLVLMDITRRISTNVDAGAKPGFGPMNAFTHMRAFPPGDFKEVVRPNFDTLYSIAWLDVSKEPMIVSAPDTQERYYMLPIIDMWTDVIAVPGKRTSGTKARHFAVTGPNWTGVLPEGVTRIPASTPYLWIIGRTQTNGPKDYEAVHKVQDGYKLTRLSHWGKEPGSIPATIDPNVDMKTPPLFQVHTMPAKRYFAYAAELMQVHPPHMTDGSILLRMKHIGLELGKSFNFDKLDGDLQKALTDGVGIGQERMKKYVATRAIPRNGWALHPGEIGVYGNDYLGRAVIAMIGLGANPPEDAIYPLNVADSDGKPLMGEHRYVMHFGKEELPPVDAFWSVTMYDAEGFTEPNPLNRYAIGDRDNLSYNQDGSLDIYLQHPSPGEEKEANWLPSPKTGKLGVTMRLYAPKPQAISGAWWPPAIKRVDK